MFFSSFRNLEASMQSRKYAFAEGFASAFDIAGDVTSPYLEQLPSSAESVMDALASDYDKITKDYSRAVNKVVKRSEKE